MTPPIDGIRPLDSRLGFVYVRAALRVRQLYTEQLADAGLLPNHHAILSILNESGPCHQKLLASRVALDPGDIVAYLDALQDMGYVSRERDPADRRRQIVTVEKTGREVLARADQLLTQAESTVFAPFTVEQKSALFTLSEQIRIRVDNLRVSSH